MALNEILDEFAGSRNLPPYVEAELDKYTVPLGSATVYRGLPYLKERIRDGEIIMQWNGSTHWTLDKSIADRFTMDYINEDYVEEIAEEKGMETSDVFGLFVPLILTMDAPDVPVVELYKYVREGLADEKEVTIRGYDFRLSDIKEVDGCFYATAKPVKRAA